VRNSTLCSDEEVAHYSGVLQPGRLRAASNYYRAAADERPAASGRRSAPAVGNAVLFLFGARRVRTAEAMGAGLLEDAWRPIFPKAQARNLGQYGHFLQWEAPEQVNHALLAFLGEDVG